MFLEHRAVSLRQISCLFVLQFQFLLIDITLHVTKQFSVFMPPHVTDR